MSGITQWTWSGVPDAEAGTLKMWPGAADELALPMRRMPSRSTRRHGVRLDRQLGISGGG